MSANSTNVTSNEFTRPFTDGQIIPIAISVITLFVLGLIFNAITMVVIWINPKLRSDKFMLIIFSLCTSDLVSALISWVWLHRRTWGFDDFAPVPAIFCKIFWGGDLMTTLVTSLHIFTFACCRLVAIRFPINFKRFTRKRVKRLLIAIWVFTFLVGFIPFVLWFEAKKRDRTSDAPDARWPACTLRSGFVYEYVTYLHIVYPILIYVPLVGVVIASLTIASIVYKNSNSKFKRSEKRKRKDRQCILQLLLIALCFAVGYTPITAYDAWSTNSFPNTVYYKKLDYWFGVSGYICLRFSETMNPIFYNIGSPKIRAATRKLLNGTFKCVKSTPNEDSEITTKSTSRVRSSQHNHVL